MIERINWMADRSEKGLHQSAGIMVNYVYRYFPLKTNFPFSLQSIDGMALIRKH